MKKKMSQASLDNLKKGTPWTTERAKRYARYGQKKSVETKKRNKAMTLCITSTACASAARQKVSTYKTERNTWCPDPKRRRHQSALTTETTSSRQPETRNFTSQPAKVRP